MGWDTPGPFVYSYLAFAVVFLASAIPLAIVSVRVTSLLSRHRTPPAPAPTLGDVSAVVGVEVARAARRVEDSLQTAVIVPLAYIVGSLFLGTLLAKQDAATSAGLVNSIWVLLTLASGAASVFASVTGVRAGRAIRSELAEAPDYVVDYVTSGGALWHIERRLGASVALLVMMLAFTAVNMWSVAASLDELLQAPFLL